MEISSPGRESLSPADSAVKYLLDRIQHDVDLRWHLVGTQAFHLLCAAEAAYLGDSVEAVEGRRSIDLTPEHHRREPEIVRLRKLCGEGD